MENLNRIKRLIYDDKAEEALPLLDEIIKNNPSSDEAFYLRGNAYRKLDNIKQAIHDYLCALELNPDSPAKEAHAMLVKIMNFYNKDMYNH